MANKQKEGLVTGQKKGRKFVWRMRGRSALAKKFDLALVNCGSIGAGGARRR